MARNKLIGHILDERLKEIGIAKGNTFDRELKWKKRQWNIAPALENKDNNTFIIDKKGITHCYVNVNESDGTIHFLTPKQLNLYSGTNPIDKCGECGGRISVDSQEARIVNRKNIIKSFWGLDNSGRREYGYCPLSPETMLSRAQFEINGCPLVRVYITNWNQLTLLDQQTIDSQLRSSGFKDIGEFDSRVK